MIYSWTTLLQLALTSWLVLWRKWYETHSIFSKPGPKDSCNDRAPTIWNFLASVCVYISLLFKWSFTNLSSKSNKHFFHVQNSSKANLQTSRANCLHHHVAFLPSFPSSSQNLKLKTFKCYLSLWQKVHEIKPVN